MGWGTWEELDVLARGGLNLGWPCIEGPAVTSYASVTPPPGIDCSAYGSSIDPASPTPPLAWWSHRTASLSNPPGAIANSIIGGAWYGGTSYPSSCRDRMFFGDFIGRKELEGALINAIGIGVKGEDEHHVRKIDRLPPR